MPLTLSKYADTPFSPLHPLYCPGRESRLPLKLRGQALGPRCELPFDELDMGTIFMGSPHTYQLQLANTGSIPANFRFTSQDSAFSRHFTFRPEQGSVAQGQQYDIEVSAAGVRGGACQDGTGRASVGQVSGPINYCVSVSVCLCLSCVVCPCLLLCYSLSVSLFLSRCYFVVRFGFAFYTLYSSLHLFSLLCIISRLCSTAHTLRCVASLPPIFISVLPRTA